MNLFHLIPMRSLFLLTTSLHRRPMSLLQVPEDQKVLHSRPLRVQEALRMLVVAAPRVPVVVGLRMLVVLELRMLVAMVHQMPVVRVPRMQAGMVDQKPEYSDLN